MRMRDLKSNTLNPPVLRTTPPFQKEDKKYGKMPLRCLFLYFVFIFLTNPPSPSFIKEGHLSLDKGRYPKGEGFVKKNKNIFSIRDVFNKRYFIFFLNENINAPIKKNPMKNR